MTETVHIRLEPLGASLSVGPGTPLQDILFAQGVEFPCGGRGRCKGCRVKVLRGSLPVTSDDERLLTLEERTDGWRLACRAAASEDLTLEFAQWEPAILSDDASFTFQPREGLGVAVDLGTTTLVAQLLDLKTGQVLAVRTALNHQARHGADIMSRIGFALNGGQALLQSMIRTQLGQIIRELVETIAPARSDLKDVVVVGNTAMHHLFCGVSVEPLAHFPFAPEQDGLFTFTWAQLGWEWCGFRTRAASARSATIRFLPCLGGFVGSDILGGILATRLHDSATLVGLIDLGTNGEIVVGNRGRLLCASTAAGPAFEGARISMGMRAATGAISSVSIENGRLHCRVLGGGEPRGLCGSGLVDAVACGLDLGWIELSGRIANGSSLPLAGTVCLSQKDIRELQLAKGAIAAGIRILLQQWGASAEELSRIYLAGAFGNYICRSSARRIGLLDFPSDRVEPAGNTALRGAKMALFDLESSDGPYRLIRRNVEHISLHEDAHFQERFVEEMGFAPERFN